MDVRINFYGLAVHFRLLEYLRAFDIDVYGFSPPFAEALNTGSDIFTFFDDKKTDIFTV